jgi:DNA-binding NarL/FixJ family response regulator
MRVVVSHETAVPEGVRRTLLGMGMECGAADCVPLADLPVRLTQGPANLILVLLGPTPSAAHDAIRQALTLTQTPILAAGPTQDAAQILQALQSGARAYLDESRLQADLEANLEKLHATGEVKHGQGHVLGVVSAIPRPRGPG